MHHHQESDLADIVDTSDPNYCLENYVRASVHRSILHTFKEMSVFINDLKHIHQQVAAPAGVCASSH